MPAADADDTAVIDLATCRHPDWCWSATCETAGPTTTHLSAPIIWRMEGSDVAVLMRRRQEGADRETLIEMHLTNEAYPHENTLLFLTDRDVDRLFTGVHELRGCH